MRTAMEKTQSSTCTQCDYSLQSKSKWTFEDDQRILTLVKTTGRNWMEISKHFPGKTGKQIRERFLNKLDPNLRMEAWTKEEDILILDLYKT